MRPHSREPSLVGRTQLTWPSVEGNSKLVSVNHDEQLPARCQDGELIKDLLLPTPLNWEPAET